MKAIRTGTKELVNGEAQREESAWCENASRGGEF